MNLKKFINQIIHSKNRMMELLKKYVLEIKTYGVFIILLILSLYYLERCLTFSNSLYDIKSSISAQIGILISFYVIYICKPTGVKFWLSYAVFVLLYVGTSVMESFLGYYVASHEYLAAFAMGSSFFFLSYFLLALSKTIPNKIISSIASIISILLFLMFLFYILIFYGYYFLEKVMFKPDIILTIIQTNFLEAYEYVYVNYSIFSCILIIVTVSLLLCWISKCLYKSCKRIVTFNIINIVLIFWGIFFESILVMGMLFSDISLDCVAKRTITLSYYILADYSKFIKTNQNLLDTIDIDLKDNSPSIHVLVIGESLTRDFMSLYNYKDVTNPRLSELYEKEDLIKFNKAYSNFTYTIHSLSMALTSRNQYDKTSLSSSVSLIALAKKAGYKVYWISNQFKSSILDTPLTSLIMQADEAIFAHAKDRDKAKDQDEVVLENISDIKPDEKVLVIFHLLGSHMIYEKRYTPEFNIFSNEEVENVNYYKNTVIYNDWVISEIINSFKRFKNFKSLIYFSDHGADPYLKTDHSSTHFTFRMVRIPFLFYYTPAYKKDHLGLIDNLKKNVDECFTNDLIFNLQLDVLSIKTPVNDLQYSIGSDLYSINCKNALTLHSQTRIWDDPELGIDKKNDQNDQNN